MSYQRIEKCGTCKGTKRAPGTGMVACPKCMGHRAFHSEDEEGNSKIKICPECNGDGKIIEQKCNICAGEGSRLRTKTR